MPVSGQSPAPTKTVATTALLRSALVSRALAEAASTHPDPATRSHIRQTTIARAYHDALGKLDHETLQQLEHQELLRGPDFKRFHRGSNFTYPQTPRITKAQKGAWQRAIERAPRKPHGAKASAGALPAITATTLIVADELAKQALRVGTVQVSARDLAQRIRPKERAIKYALQALKAHGYLHRHLVVRWHRGRFQRHCVQDACAYVLQLPTGTPLWRYPGG